MTLTKPIADQILLTDYPRRCRTCEVGSHEPLCWICSQATDAGNVTLLARGTGDEKMMRCKTNWSPDGNYVEFKALDGLEPRLGDTYNPQRRFRR